MNSYPEAPLLDRLWERLHIERDWVGHGRNPHLETLFLRLAHHLKPSLLLEVGAHEAHFSRQAVDEMPTVQAIALEANPYVWQRYVSKMPSAVRYLNLAAGASTGCVDLHIPLRQQPGRGNPRINSIASLRQRHWKGAPQETVRCEMTTLDSLVMDIGIAGPAILWIDVEGATGDVLQGSQRILAERVLALFVELETRPDWSGQWLAAEVIDFLRQRQFIPIVRDRQAPHQFNQIFLRADVMDDAVLDAVAEYARTLVTTAPAQRNRKPAAAETIANERPPDTHQPSWETGLALIEAQQFAQAQHHFERLVNQNPEQPLGLRGLLRLAQARGDLPAQARLLQALIQRNEETPGESESILCQAMAQGQFVEVYRLLGTQLQSSPLYARAAPWLVKQSAQRRAWLDLHRRAQAMPGLTAAIADNNQLLSSYTTGLYNIGLDTSTLNGIIDTLVGTSTTTRLQRIELLLLVRRDQEALEELLELARDRSASALNIKHLLYLGLNVAGDAEQATLDHLLEHIETQPVTDRKLLNRRLAGLFIRIHQQSLAHLTGHGAWPSASSGEEVEDQVERILEQATVPPSETLDLLRRLPQAVRALRQSGTQLWLEPVYALHDAIEIAHRIGCAFTANRGFCLIRLGDGEGVFLPYCSALAHHQTADQRSFYRYCWGQPDLATETAQILMQGLDSAIRTSDILGVPELSRISRALLKAESVASLPARPPRGILAIVDLMFGMMPGSATILGTDQVLSSCHLHQALEHWGLWDVLLPHAETCCLITCHPQLKEYVEKRFGIRVREVFLIPGQEQYAQGFGVATHSTNVITWFETFKAQVSANALGKIYLVAAGFFGKLLCAEIKAAGGIALDMGSIVDYWLGFNSRPFDNIFGRCVVQKNQYRYLASLDQRIASLW